MSDIFSTIVVAEYTNRAGTETYLLHLLPLVSQYEKKVLLVTIGGDPADKVSRLALNLGFTHWRIDGNSDVKLNNLRTSKQIQQQQLNLLPQRKAKRVIVSVGTPGALTQYLNLGISSYYILHTYPHGNRHRFFGRLIARRIPSKSEVVCVSEYSKKELFKFWGTKFNVSVVPNGVPTPEVSEREGSSFPVVLTLGSVEQYKNPELWLRIALRYLKSVPDSKATFIWVGEGSERLQISKQIPHDLQDQIIFAGSVEDPSSFFGKATVYLQPSKIESFGLAVAEALSFGIPCVVADTGGLPEVVSEKCSILVAPDDVSGYVSAISELLGNKKLRKRMSLEAKSRHTEMLSIESWQTRMSQTLQLQ